MAKIRHTKYKGLQFKASEDIISFYIWYGAFFACYNTIMFFCKMVEFGY